MAPVPSVTARLQFCCHIAGLSIQDKTEEPSIDEKKGAQNRIQVEGEDQSKILKLFSFLQTLTATFASFVHGGNDVRYEVRGYCSTECSQVFGHAGNLSTAVTELYWC
jgi:hypothetical protein